MTQEEINKAFEGRWRMKNYILENIDGKAANEIARDFFEAGIMIGEGEKQRPVTDAKAISLEQRAEKFCKSLNTSENIDRYGMKMLKDFYDYWTEPNRSNTKMRFELQKTWDINRRLATWARNDFNHYGNNNNKEQQRQHRLAEVAERIAEYTTDK